MGGFNDPAWPSVLRSMPFPLDPSDQSVRLNLPPAVVAGSHLTIKSSEAASANFSVFSTGKRSWRKRDADLEKGSAEKTTVPELRITALFFASPLIDSSAQLGFKRQHGAGVVSSPACLCVVLSFLYYSLLSRSSPPL